MSQLYLAYLMSNGAQHSVHRISVPTFPKDGDQVYVQPPGTNNTIP